MVVFYCKIKAKTQVLQNYGKVFQQSQRAKGRVETTIIPSQFLKVNCLRLNSPV